MTFYMTYNGNRYANLILPTVNANDIPMMRNAFDRYSLNTNRFLPLRDKPSTGKLVIDSGGFNVLNYGAAEFPWSVTEYHEWLSSLETDFEWAAVMDFACERRFDDLLSMQERVDQTLANTIAHYDLGPDYTVLPVLQGRELHDYLEFYDRLRDHGIPTEYVGLGTVCRKSNTTKIVDIERGLRANTDIERIHGFGVKISAFKYGACFDSADSNAWNSEPSSGNVVFDAGDKLAVERRADTDQAITRTYRSFIEYYKYASRLQQRALKRRRGRQANLAGFA